MNGIAFTKPLCSPPGGQALMEMKSEPIKASNETQKWERNKRNLHILKCLTYINPIMKFFLSLPFMTTNDSNYIES